MRKYFLRLAKLLPWLMLASGVLAACSDSPATVTSNPTTAPATTATLTTAAITTQVATTNVATTQPAPPTSLPPTAAPSTQNATPTTAPTLLPTAQPTVAPTATPQADTSKVGYIESLRARKYNGGPIQLGRLYEQTAQYKANLITYKSDDLTISGLMFVPTGPGPFPVALINHGHFAFNDYGPGWDTLRELRYFAANGYVTIASDYRNYGTSSKGDYIVEPGYTVDILNLIEAVKQAPYIDKNRITIMGHSMGGEITLNVIVVSKDIKVAALFGTMSADAADNFYARRDRWGGETTPQFVQYYGTPDKNPDVFHKLSPLTYFADVNVPVIIHSGTNDTTTPPEWSVKVLQGLQANGKQAELYNYPGQGHSLNGAAFDLAMQRTLKVFNQAIGKS